MKVSGKKAELVARAFVAVENKVKTAEEVQGEIRLENEHKLGFGGESFPDPMTLDGWVNEEAGISLWPQIPMVYIIKFLMLKISMIINHLRHTAIASKVGLGKYITTQYLSQQISASLNLIVDLRSE